MRKPKNVEISFGFDDSLISIVIQNIFIIFFIIYFCVNVATQSLVHWKIL